MENKEKQIIENVDMFQQLDLLRKIKREFDTYINFYITIIEEFMEYNLTCEEIEMKIIDVDKLDSMVKRGKIFHSIAINSLYFLQKYLENNR